MIRRARIVRGRAIKPSRAVELYYVSELRALVARVRKDVATLVASMKSDYLAAQSELTHDAIPKKQREAFQKLAEKWDGIDDFAKRLARNAATKALNIVDKSVAQMIKQSVAVDVSSFLRPDTKIGAAMNAAVDWNVALIKDLPAKYIGEVEDAVAENWGSGMRWEDLIDDIAERGNVSEDRAKLIARDQTNKMNGDFNKTRQTGLGIDSFVWRTSQDERVRASHAELEGQVFTWEVGATIDDEEGCIPGSPIQCRCTGEPVIDLDELAGNNDQPDLF